MARCESLDVLRQIMMDGSPEEMETGTSDSDSDVSLIVDLEKNEEKDAEPNSDNSVSNEEELNPVPVLSLKCLHSDDSSEEENEHSESDAECPSEYIDPDDVQDLTINATQNPNQSTKSEKEDEEHPHLDTISKTSSSSVSSLSAARPHSSIPSRHDWEGSHNFRIKIVCGGDSYRRTENSIFSETRNKLYISKDYPFKVLVYAENVSTVCKIRVTAVFSRVEHSYELVLRCPTHAQQDFVKGNKAYAHFVQSFSDLAIYEKNPDTGKLSVLVPYEKPQEGETFTTYLFKLSCFSSCSGGINRRPFMLVFTLEKDNVPLGRQSIEAKVCACPTRDYKIDEERSSAHKSRGNPEDNNKKNNKDSSQSNNTEKTKYSIAVRDHELYLFLKQMKAFYETSAYADKFISET